jgi:hypothetical protein
VEADKNEGETASTVSKSKLSVAQDKNKTDQMKAKQLMEQKKKRP